MLSVSLWLKNVRKIAMTTLETRERLTPGAASSALTEWHYSPSLEATDHVKIQPRYNLFIGGKFVEPHSKRWFETINPATEETLSEMAEADAEDVDRAVKEARRAYDKVWRKLPASERAKYIFRIARLIQEKSRALAVAETMNGGKPIKESRDIDIPLAAAHFFYYAGWADKLEYAFPNRNVSPVGVAGQIIPWNFPLLMAAWKIAPALAAGNTVVLKPAETTSLTSLMLAEIIQEADLPPGVVNIITGAGATGAALVNHAGRRQDRLHRIDRSRQADSALAGRNEEETDAGAGRQSAEHRLRRRADRSGRRRHHQRHLLQSGTRLLRRIAALSAGVDRRAGRPQTARTHRNAARRQSAR